MTPRKRTGRCATFVLTAALVTGALTGCQSLADAASASCEDTGSRVDALKSYDVLDSRPPGTIVPQGFEDLQAGCWEDSGEAWLYADRTYVFPGDKAEVIQHYEAAAEREGWKPSKATRQALKENRSASLCFTRGKTDDATTLDVYFLTKEILDAEETKTGPDFDAGFGYRVAVNSTADGSAASCSD
ncbi:hypothetical protein E4N62_01825 [Streptomyces sp. MNU76]|uniref:hypothetical protein n=1 Tax=Streptomyces sp. MNU76 TaxID=2560026 RepID=UPI001E5F5F46|nr:hypothetical protein [Streptomyces sp. MNU76]MCC9704111.1 hypothetical protein [Streptomyces sp. MNU76]